MIQVRIHGRGGQGVVTAAEMLARAGFLAGHEAAAIPSFGSERTGAPVVSFCRFSSQPIRPRQPVLAPDVVLLQDPTLLSADRPFHGLRSGGLVVVSTGHDAQWVRQAAGADDQVVAEAQILAVPALDIAMRELGVPKPSAAMLGAYAGARDHVTIETVERVFRAVALCRPAVVCAYPISPQTHIVEALARLVSSE